jgi:hypothetical protein
MARQHNPEYSKAQFQRDLKARRMPVSIRTIRAVLNGKAIERDRSQPKVSRPKQETTTPARGQTKQASARPSGLIVAWT